MLILVKFVLIYLLSNNCVINYGVVRKLLTWILWIKVFNIFHRISTTTVYKSSKNVETATDFKAPESWRESKYYSEGLPMLGATLQNLIAKATLARNLFISYLFLSYYQLNGRKIRLFFNFAGLCIKNWIRKIHCVLF